MHVGDRVAVPDTKNGVTKSEKRISRKECRALGHKAWGACLSCRHSWAKRPLPAPSFGPPKQSLGQV